MWHSTRRVYATFNVQIYWDVGTSNDDGVDYCRCEVLARPPARAGCAADAAQR